MFTVEKFAEMTGVDKSLAYGLLRFAEKLGIIEAGNESTGKKGKPRRIYFLQNNTWDKLAMFLETATISCLDDSDSDEFEDTSEILLGDDDALPTAVNE